MYIYNNVMMLITTILMIGTGERLGISDRLLRLIYFRYVNKYIYIYIHDDGDEFQCAPDEDSGES